MARWYEIGRLENIAFGASTSLTTDEGMSIAVWRLADGRVYATDDLCSHFFFSLHAAGRLHGSEILCLAHEARFDVTTGAALCPPARRPLTTYEVKVHHDGTLSVRA